MCSNRPVEPFLPLGDGRTPLTAARTAEIVFNQELAHVLRGKHPRWPERISVEQTNVISGEPALQPDIIVRHPGGVPVAVETEYTPATTVEDDARQRLGKTLETTGTTIEQSIAVRIPGVMARVIQRNLRQEIERAQLEFCLLSGEPNAHDRWPSAGWLHGSVDDLANCIERAALSENRVARGMEILEAGIGQTAGLLRDTCADTPATLESIANCLHQRDGAQTSRMAMAILANALTFHSVIAGAHQVDTLDQLRNPQGHLSKTRVLDAWRHILDNINYWPIFKISSDILLPIQNGTAFAILDRLAGVAADLVALGATSQQDLCGRMFQRLITDRKFLATFYTLPSSAGLLSELAAARLTANWTNETALLSLRVGDFACGTGALLNASYYAILARYRRAGGDDAQLHARMMENVLVGADIMPAASHLTASVLSNAHPTVTFTNTSIVTLPYGEQPQETGRNVSIGALDLIDAEQTRPLFGTGHQRLRGDQPVYDAELPLRHGTFDLVIMNPPFTRSTGHEAEKVGVPAPAFAGFATKDDEMRLMSRRLASIRNETSVGHGNAGLASHFVDLAHVKVKCPGGVIALVLPASFLQGKSWVAARDLLRHNYRDVVIVSIATAGSKDRAFSADTNQAEVLFVGVRREPTEDGDDTLCFVNLFRRPETVLEAVTMAQAVQHISGDREFGSITIGSTERAGCFIKSSMGSTACAGLKETAVAHALQGLVRGELRMPRLNRVVPIPVTELSSLGERGLYHMDISGEELNKAGMPRGPFDIVAYDPNQVPTFPVLWSHDAQRERQLVVMPDCAGEVRAGCADHANLTWTRTASRLHYNRDFQINSQPLGACITEELTIGGHAWPNFRCRDPRWEKALVLWANSTLGVILFWWMGTRQHRGRARITISRLPFLPVLDPRDFDERQFELVDEVFAEFRGRNLLPANEAWRDTVRQALDRRLLMDLLELPEEILGEVALLRRQWGAEPSVHGGKGTSPVATPR